MTAPDKVANLAAKIKSLKVQQAKIGEEIHATQTKLSVAKNQWLATMVLLENKAITEACELLGVSEPTGKWMLYRNCVAQNPKVYAAGSHSTPCGFGIETESEPSIDWLREHAKEFF